MAKCSGTYNKKIANLNTKFAIIDMINPIKSQKF